MSEQLSLSVSDLTRILVEEALSEMFLPADNSVRRLHDRMEYLMQVHELSPVTMATLLAPGISALPSSGSRIDSLTT